MDEQWHLSRGDNQGGPFTRDELARQLASLNLDSERVLVWKEGMSDWVELSFSLR